VPAPVVAGADALVAASQGGVVLSGIVPSEETAQTLRDAAASVYSDEQITDELVVEEGATRPAAM
jgi:osmotically-inducible protein OsmY